MKIPFLKTRALLKEITSVKYADEDTGQIDNYDTKPSIPPNSVLITINLLNTQDISETRQLCRVAVVMRFWYDPVKQETSSLAPDAAVTRSLAHNDTIDAIYKKFQGYFDDEIDTFSRQSDVKETRRDTLCIRKMVYTTSYIDLTAEE
ncbi:hypothetical protein [Mucilaginibacter sp.]|uniref:hypothetical protein n=1 Tax=Mucilaginibacter sp. TaxID=1882438 RepID=UPI003264627D